jgi:tetraprenyl-beta-curcumene synthase
VPPPTNLWTLTPKIFLEVRQYVHKYLGEWRRQAAAIPSPELRKQALASIAAKTFHCEGGSIYALLADDNLPETIRFIVAYQTISDYLDNLCDRSTSLDPDDFRILHTSMRHALTPGANTGDYYCLRDERDDGGYLISLVKTCQDVLALMPAYSRVAPAIHELCDYYCNLQVFKHVRKEERLSAVKAWFDGKKEFLPPMEWYEFAACCGSTVGIFCLVSHASNKDCSDTLAKNIRDAYFPWVQGLHILLDYLIDQDEDSLGGDLNFCSYYKDYDEMVSRLAHFYEEANQSISALPYAEFHRMINQGMLGIYFADDKVYRQKDVRRASRKMIRLGGGVSLFLYLVCWLYRRVPFKRS